MSFQVLVESMDSQHAHIGLYASRDVRNFLPILPMVFVLMVKLLNLDDFANMLTSIASVA